MFCPHNGRAVLKGRSRLDLATLLIKLLLSLPVAFFRRPTMPIKFAVISRPGLPYTHNPIFLGQFGWGACGLGGWVFRIECVWLYVRLCSRCKCLVGLSFAHVWVFGFVCVCCAHAVCLCVYPVFILSRLLARWAALC